MREEPKIISADSTHIIGTWRCVVVAVWRGHTTVQHMDIAKLAMRQLSQKLKQNIAYLTIIEASAPTPTTDVRDASIKLIREGERAVQCWATVSEMAGFQASVLRSVTTGLLLVFRPGNPFKVLATIPEAATWMANELRTKDLSFGRVEELVEAVERLRQKGERGEVLP